MNMKIIFCLFLSVALCCLAMPLFAGGLSTSFGEVKVANLKIGQEHSMEETADFPLVVCNTSDEVIELKMEALYPKDAELKDGYQPIPDINWIVLEQDYFVLDPGDEAKTDVIIKIPDDNVLSGRKYQVYLWSHTIGRSLGVGLKSRLLFTVAE